MRHRLPICLFALALPFAQTAVSQQPSKDVEAGDDIDRLPADLDNFVRQAIDQGLLQPALPAGTGPEGGVRAASAQPAPVAVEDTAETEPEEPAQPVKISLRPRQGEEEAHGCSASSPYDFSEFSRLSTYQDLMSWRSVLEAEESAISISLLAKGYIAMGLSEEGRMQLIGKTDQTSTALRELAWLIEGQTYPNLAYFEEMADCHQGAKIWLAFAQLRASNPAGATTLAEEINDYNRLPLQMRTIYARQAIPILDRMKETELTQALLKSFTAEELKQSSHLRFVTTLVAFSIGTEGTEELLRQYVRQVEYQEDATAALRRAGLHVSADFESEHITRLVDNYGKLPSDVRVEDSLGVLMTDLKSAADYSTTRQLADLPAARSNEAQGKLADHYIELVNEDLDSDDTLANLKGMDALLNAGGLLEARDDLDATFGKAAALATHLGLTSMADKLSARLQSDDALALAQAELAYGLGDSAQLTALQKRYPEQAGIIELAALDAVRTGDDAAFRRLQASLPADPDFALRLIAADAGGGHWILPERYFKTALDVQGDDKKAQLEKLMKARPGNPPASSAAAKMTLADVPGGLDRIGKSLQPDTMEMR